MKILIIKLLFDILLVVVLCIWIIKITCPNKTDKKYGQYPCNDYLNNALRDLLNDNPNTKEAISEICYCISKGDGYFCDDVKEKLIRTELCPYPIKNEEDQNGTN